MSRFIEIVDHRQAPDYQFICKAVSDDPTRYFMNFVYCEDNKLIATDGRRLHMLDLGENPYEFKEKKFYRVLKATTKIVWIVEMDEDQGTFPNYKRVFPKGESVKTINFRSMSRNYSENSRQIAKIMRLFETYAVLNTNYLDDLPEDTEWIVSFYGDTIGVNFVSNNKTALLMPIQGEDD